MVSTTYEEMTGNPGIAKPLDLRAGAENLLALSRNKFNMAKGLLLKKLGWAWNTVKGFVGSHSTSFTIGASALLTTKRSYHSLVNGIHWVGAKTVSIVTGAASWVVSKARDIVGGIPKLIGTFAPGAASAIDRVLDFAAAAAETGIQFVRNIVGFGLIAANIVLTSPAATRVVNMGSLIVTTGLVANVVTGGTVAATVAPIPFVGGALAAAVAGGWATVGVLGGIVAFGIINALVITPLFGRRNKGPVIADGDPVSSASTIVKDEASTARAEAELDEVGVQAYQARTEAMVDEAAATLEAADRLVEAAAAQRSGDPARRHGNKPKGQH